MKTLPTPRPPWYEANWLRAKADGFTDLWFFDPHRVTIGMAKNQFMTIPTDMNWVDRYHEAIYREIDLYVGARKQEWRKKLKNCGTNRADKLSEKAGLAVFTQGSDWYIHATLSESFLPQILVAHVKPQEEKNDD